MLSLYRGPGSVPNAFSSITPRSSCSNPSLPHFQMRNRRPGEVRKLTQDHPANKWQISDTNPVWFDVGAQALNGSTMLFPRGLSSSLTQSLHFLWEAAEAQRREMAFPRPQSEWRWELRLEPILPTLHPQCRSHCMSRKIQSSATCWPSSQLIGPSVPGSLGGVCPPRLGFTDDGICSIPQRPLCGQTAPDPADLFLLLPSVP